MFGGHCCFVDSQLVHYMIVAGLCNRISEAPKVSLHPDYAKNLILT
jgi:hypothetical protein